MNKLAILGASGHGKVAAEIAELSGWEKVVFFDDAWPRKSRNEHWQVEGSGQMLLNRLADFAGVFVAIGDNSIRHTKQTLLASRGAPLVSLIHPQTVVSKYAQIDEGTLVVAGAVVNPFARIAAGCIINSGATIDHDCRLGNSVHVCPGANLAGGVTVGARTMIGIGAKIIQEIEIGSDAVIGAGAVVIKRVENNSVVVGSPAVACNQKIKKQC